MCGKRNLNDLSLHWGGVSHTGAGGVLDGLEPHQSLEHLLIMGYSGKCRSWWNKKCLTYLNHIEWWEFSSWEVLPSFGQLPLLRFLYLVAMNAVKWIGPEFYGSNNTSKSKPFPSLE